MEVSILLFVIGAIAAVVYLYSKWAYSYWKRHGVYSPEPEFFYGNVKDQIKQKISLGDQFMKFYNEAKARGDKHIGVYMFFAKVYVPVDLEVIKNMLQRDFVHFMNHGLFNVNEEIDPLNGHLFHLENDKWRNLRAKLTPTFTSGKLKMMFQTLVDCTPALENILNDHANMRDPVDIKDVVSRFTTDIIGSCAFGLECNTLKNPNSEFLTFGKKIFDPSIFMLIKTMISFVTPKTLMPYLPMKLTPVDVEDFFMDVVKKTVKYREENNIFRKDFLHLLLQLRNQGKVTDDESIKKETNEEPGMTMNEFAAQCFVFFVAGFETSATTMTFALLELAQNQEVQEQLREDIRLTLEKHDGKLTYDAVMEMTYLNKVVQETLRKHPPVAGLPRVCTKDYQVPGTDVIIKKDTLVHIPVVAIHRDPELYPEPDKFDPERFSEENKAKRSPFAFLTFGEGPRICIGARFGLMQAKVGLITVIRNFNVSLNTKTSLPIVYETKTLVNAVKGGVWLNISKIK